MKEIRTSVIMEARNFKRECQVNEKEQINHNTPTAAAKNLKNKTNNAKSNAIYQIQMAG